MRDVTTLSKGDENHHTISMRTAASGCIRNGLAWESGVDGPQHGSAKYRQRNSLATPPMHIASPHDIPNIHPDNIDMGLFLPLGQWQAKANGDACNTNPDFYPPWNYHYLHRAHIAHVDRNT